MSVWSKIYERINWKDLPQRLTALAARNLNKMDLAIDTLDDRTIGLNTRLEAVEENPITVDTELKSDSENPVQNKVIYAAFEDLLPEETVQGNPIVVNDASGLNAKACSVDLLPIQDLHGYDSPWAGGAGKNKCPDLYSYYTVGGYAYFKLTNELYNMSFTNKDTGIDISGCYIGFMNNYPQETSVYKWVINNGTVTSNRTNTQGGINCDTLVIYPNNEATFNKLFSRYKIQVELGSTATSYAPYSNICPISGRTEASVVRTGKNLMSPLVKGVGLIASTGAEQVSATSATTDYIPIKFTEDVPYYYLSGLSNQINSFINAYNANKQSLGRTSGNTRTSLVLDKNFASAGGTPQGTGEIAYIRITQFVIAGQTATIDVVDSLTPQLEIGQTATDYEAYQGETVTVQFGQTVYGGTLDVTNGKLTIDSLIAILNGTEGWTKYQSTNRYYADGLSFQGLLDTNGDSISNEFSFGGFITSMAGASTEGKYYLQNAVGRVAINSDTFSTASELETYLSTNNLQIVFPLSTPTELTLTPEEISLLKGNNTLSTDGDNIILKYSADIKAWVENQLSV